MSKYKYKWYPNVVHAIKYYPELLQAKNDMQSQSVTASYSGMPKSGQASRTTENSATRFLSKREEEELQAVSDAIENIGRQKDGREVLKLVESYYWSKKFYKLDGAAIECHMCRKTAYSRNIRFVYEVAKNMGYM